MTKTAIQTHDGLSLLASLICTVLALPACSEDPPVTNTPPAKTGEGGAGGAAVSTGQTTGAGGEAVGVGSGGGGSGPVAPNFAACVAVQAADHGTLCAVVPSHTDAAIRDFRGNANNPGLGFGYHAIAVPDTPSPIGVWVHFGGSFGSPYLPTTDTFASRVWLDELMSEGYLVIQVAYSNPESIAGQICNPSSPGHTVDNCAGDVRREVLEGVDHSSEVEVPMVDGVNHRIERLVAYLRDEGWSVPVAQGGLDWLGWHVSGHSQGAGHAYYVARNYGVASACFLGGPYDYPDAVSPSPTPIADWYLDGSSLTPIADLGAVVVTSDTGYNAFVAAYGVMGLEKNVHWFEATGDYTNDIGEPVDGHAASLAAPNLAPLRSQACF